MLDHRGENIMLLYNDNNKNKDYITDIDLQYLGAQIANFCKAYREGIFIRDNPEYSMVLSHLEELAYFIKTRKYDVLFEDPSVVIYDNEYEKEHF